MSNTYINLKAWICNVCGLKSLTLASKAFSQSFGATTYSDKLKFVWKRCKCKSSSGIPGLCETCSTWRRITTPKATKGELGTFVSFCVTVQVSAKWGFAAVWTVCSFRSAGLLRRVSTRWGHFILLLINDWQNTHQIHHHCFISFHNNLPPHIFSFKIQQVTEFTHIGEY